MLKVEFKKIGRPEEQLYVTNYTLNERLKFNEVLLEVLFFPINPADLLLVAGKYASPLPSLPSSIGAECVAKVKKIGKNVTKVNINDIVIPLTRNNWSEKLKIDQDNLIKIKNNINLLQASMLKVNPATAYLMLNNYVKLNPGDKILQNASNSGVGSYIIQLAKHYKIKTINLIRRKAVSKILKKLGANNVILDNKNNGKLKKLNAKLFIDAVGGPKVNSLASCLQDHATIINYGLLSGKNIEIDSHKIIFNNISIKGFWLPLWLQKMSYEEKFNLYTHLSDLITNKILYTNIDKVYHITDFKKAVAKASKYKRKGKIIVGFDKDLINKCR